MTFWFWAWPAVVGRVSIWLRWCPLRFWRVAALVTFFTALVPLVSRAAFLVLIFRRLPLALRILGFSYVIATTNNLSPNVDKDGNPSDDENSPPDWAGTC